MTQEEFICQCRAILEQHSTATRYGSYRSITEEDLTKAARRIWDIVEQGRTADLTLENLTAALLAVRGKSQSVQDQAARIIELLK